ncbi:caspase family protein [Streptomyces sp. NPDC015131]|uniref:caspase family protein n=1 Tax=Streptomyces sp. NPDC015131 TaxID=3364941 RepID=UPI0036FCB312
MGAHRALLLFVPAYASEDWPDLEYLRDEYREVRATLADQGYEIDGSSGCDTYTAAELLKRMSRFIADAGRGERQLVYLSGHGFHHDGRHWFAGADSDVGLLGAQTLQATNVELGSDWARQVDRSAVEQAMFVVDACRDRLVPEGRGELGSPLTPPVGNDRLSFLMACEPDRPAAVAGHAEAPDGRYSLFTQALREVLADTQTALSADRLRDLLESAMEDLRTRQAKPPRSQVPRLSGDEGGPRFDVLPARPEPGGERRNRLRDHAVWSRTTDRAEATELLE